MTDTLPTLEDALLDWLCRIFPATLNAALHWPGASSSGGHFPIHDDCGASKALEHIRKLLGKSPIRSAKELDFILRSALHDALSPDQIDLGKLTAEDWKRILQQLSARLSNPLQSWNFQVPLAVGAQFEVSYVLNEKRRLMLSTRTAEDHTLQVFFTGEVRATGEHRAQYVVEDDIRAVLGISVALQLAGTIRLPSLMAVNLTLSGPSTHVLPLHPAVAGLIPRSFFCLPTSLDSLEEAFVKADRIADLVARRIRPLLRIMQTPAQRNQSLRNAAALLFDAMSARDDGAGIAFSLMSMEAVLLEKADSASTMARLAEAVTYRLGASATKRAWYRKAIKDLYSARSVFVHTGRVDPQLADRDFAILLAKEVLYRELIALPAEEA